MVITYHGGQCFKVTSGTTTLAFDPISKDAQLKAPRFGADITLVSLQDPDFNGVEQTAHGDNEPFVIHGPGEYEIADVLIHGLPSASHFKDTDRNNTMYLVELEGIRLLFLGALGEKELPQKAQEAIESVDILFVPVGGDGVLGPADAHEVSVELEPSLIIPMHYPTQAGTLGRKDALEQFLKEAGATNGKAIEKLTLKRKDLEGKEGEIVVLAA